MSTPYPLWDLPTRLFHWLLVLLLPPAWLTAEFQEYDAHQWIGYTLLVLVAFRLVWGLVGSVHSRFSDFVVGPRALLLYLRKGIYDSAGHNPLGGLGVVMMLLLLALQAVSGLFNTDDLAFTGPLHYWASNEVRDAMGAAHDWAFNLLLGMVGLHLLGVLYHQRHKKEPLVQAMVKGSAQGREGQSAGAPLWLAVLIVVLLCGALWFGLEQAPQAPAMRW